MPINKAARNQKLLVEAFESHIKDFDQWRSEEDGIDELLPFWNTYNTIATAYDEASFKESLTILKLIIIFAALLSAAQVAALFASSPSTGGNDLTPINSTLLEILQQLRNDTIYPAIDSRNDTQGESPDDSTLDQYTSISVFISLCCTFLIVIATFSLVMIIGSRRRQISGKAIPKEKAFCRNTFYEGWMGIQLSTYFLAGSLEFTVLLFLVAIAVSNDIPYHVVGSAVGIFAAFLCVVRALYWFVMVGGTLTKSLSPAQKNLPHTIQTDGPRRYQNSVEKEIRMMAFAAAHTPQIEQYRQHFMHILQALFTISPVPSQVSRHEDLLSMARWDHVFELLCANYVGEEPKPLDQYDEEHISDIARILIFLTMPGEWQGLKVTKNFLKGIQESNLEGGLGDIQLLISLAGTRRGAFKSDFELLWGKYCADAIEIPQSTTRWFLRSAPPLPSTQVLADSVARIDKHLTYTIKDLQNITYFLTAFTSLMVPEGVKSFDKNSGCSTLSSYSTSIASVASWNPSLETLDSQIHLYCARLTGKGDESLGEFWSLVDSATWSPLRVDVIHALLYGLTQVLPTAISYPSPRQDTKEAENLALVSKHIGPLLAALSPRNLIDTVSSGLLLQTDPAKWLINTISRFDYILTGQYPDDWAHVAITPEEVATDKQPLTSEGPENIARITAFIRRAIGRLHWPYASSPSIEEHEAKLDLESRSTVASSTSRVAIEPPRTTSPSERGTILRLLTEHIILLCQFLNTPDLDFSLHQAELAGLADPSLRIVASVISGTPSIELVPTLSIDDPVDPAILVASSFLIAKIDLCCSFEVVRVVKPLLFTGDEAACLDLVLALLDRPEIFNNDPNVFDGTFIRHLLDVGTGSTYQADSITIMQRLMQLSWVPALFVDQGGITFLSQKVTSKHARTAEAVLGIILRALSSLRNAEDLKSAVCATDKALFALKSQDAQYDGAELADALLVAAASMLSDGSPAGSLWRLTVDGLVLRLRNPGTP